MAVKKRRNHEDEDAVDFIDSDDQEKLVKSMEIEMRQQQELIHQAFRVVCWGSAVLSLLCCLLVQLRNTTTTSTAVLLRWVHGLFAGGLHVVVSYAVTARSDQSLKFFFYTPYVIMVLVAVNTLFFLRRSEESQEFIFLHQGMLLANSLTAAVGLWFRHDHNTMNQSLENLKKSQYKYKSI